MEAFRVKPGVLKNYSQELIRYEKMLKEYGSSVERIKHGLRGKIVREEEIGNRLSAVVRAMETESLRMNKVGNSLASILTLYEHSEKTVAGNVVQPANLTMKEAAADKMALKDIELDSVITDDNGMYGGDQGKPQRNQTWLGALLTGQGVIGNKNIQKKELYQTIRNNLEKDGKKLSDRECAAYLKKVNSEGCGYVAIVNTIFAAYEGREKEFEETFGFPMYYKGDLNYDRLLVDFYSATDNHVEKDGKDYVDMEEDRNEDEMKNAKYDYWKDTTGRGTFTDDREYRTQLYLKDKGVSVDVETVCEVTPETFADVAKDGYIIMSYHDGQMQDAKGNNVSIDGGHAMLVTGVTSDGRYKVSSWGEEYYIDPNQNIDGKTTIQFSRYQYEGVTVNYN